MSEEEIFDGNNLIAEFMKKKVPKKLAYHRNWNELMLVVDKIINLDITPAPNWTGYQIEIIPRGYVSIKGAGNKIVKNVSLCGSLINALWEAIVAFLVKFNIDNEASKEEQIKNMFSGFEKREKFKLLPGCNLTTNGSISSTGYQPFPVGKRVQVEKISENLGLMIKLVGRTEWFSPSFFKETKDYNKRYN